MKNVFTDVVCNCVTDEENVHNGAIESSGDNGFCGYCVDMVKDVKDVNDLHCVKDVCYVDHTYHVDYTHMVANTYMIAHVYTSHIVCPVSRELNVAFVSDVHHVDNVCRVFVVNYIHRSDISHNIFLINIVDSGYKEYEVYLLFNEDKQNRPHGQHNVFHVYHIGTSSFCFCKSWEFDLCHGLTRQAPHKTFSFQGNTVMQCAMSVIGLKIFLALQCFIGLAGSFPVIVILKPLIIKTNNHIHGRCLQNPLRSKIYFGVAYYTKILPTAPHSVLNIGNKLSEGTAASCP